MISFLLNITNWIRTIPTKSPIQIHWYRSFHNLDRQWHVLFRNGCKVPSEEGIFAKMIIRSCMKNNGEREIWKNKQQWRWKWETTNSQSYGSELAHTQYLATRLEIDQADAKMIVVLVDLDDSVVVLFLCAHHCSSCRYHQFSSSSFGAEWAMPTSRRHRVDQNRNDSWASSSMEMEWQCEPRYDYDDDEHDDDDHCWSKNDAATTQRTAPCRNTMSLVEVTVVGLTLRGTSWSERWLPYCRHCRWWWWQ